MSTTAEKLKAAVQIRRKEELDKLLNMMFEAKNELDSLERQKDVIMEEAFRRLSAFAVDRMSKRDMESLLTLHRRLPPEFKVWLDKTRDIHELTTGRKLEDPEDA